MAPTAKSKSKAGTRKRATTPARTNARRTKTSRRRPRASIGSTAAKMLTGAANAVRSLVPGLAADDTATAFLAKQHREVEASFQTALGSEEARIRRTTRDEIIRQLELHTKLEEAIFYPAVREINATEADDLVLEAIEEHHVVKMVLKELPKVEPKDETFKAKMTVLKELVAHHVREEEREMFPLAESRLGPERTRELAEAMAARAARE